MPLTTTNGGKEGNQGKNGAPCVIFQGRKGKKRPGTWPIGKHGSHTLPLSHSLARSHTQHNPHLTQPASLFSLISHRLHSFIPFIITPLRLIRSFTHHQPSLHLTFTFRPNTSIEQPAVCHPSPLQSRFLHLHLSRQTFSHNCLIISRQGRCLQHCLTTNTSTIHLLPIILQSTSLYKTRRYLAHR